MGNIKQMKGLVFTLDAMFAFIVVSVGITILLFLNFFSQVPGSSRYSQVSLTTSYLLSTEIMLTQNASSVAAQVVSQNLGANESWPQFMGNSQRQGNNGYAPSLPSVSYIFNATHNILTNVAADYGNLYFATQNAVFAVNATNNETVWTSNKVTSPYNSVAVYHGDVFIANSVDLFALNSYNGNMVWSTSLSSNPTSQLLVYQNQIVLGEGSNSLYSFYAGNGTLAWSFPFNSPPVFAATADGNLAVVNSSGYLFMVAVPSNTFSGSNINVLWSKPLATAGITTQNGKIFSASGNTVEITYINETNLLAQNLGSGNIITGVAFGYGDAVYQTEQSVSVLNFSGKFKYNFSAPAYFGSYIANAIPVVSKKGIYTIWSNGIAMQNITNGDLEWFTNIPTAQYSALSSYLTLAYGRLYAVAGTRLIAYGACNAKDTEQLLPALAEFYTNLEGGCGQSLLYSIGAGSNYSLSINGTFAPSMHVAKLNASAYNNSALGTSGFFLSNSSLSNLSSFTITAWVDPNAYSTKQYTSDIYTIGPLSGNWALNFSMGASGQLAIDDYNGVTLKNFTSNMIIPLNKWSFVAVTFNNSKFVLYVNNKQASAPGQVETGNHESYIGLYYRGYIANMQIYNTSLGPAQMQDAYLSGMAGLPVSYAHLIGWYPLMGDANDYSGSHNTGYPYHASWPNSTYVPSGLSNAQQVSSSSAVIPVRNYSGNKTVTRLKNVGILSWD